MLTLDDVFVATEAAEKWKLAPDTVKQACLDSASGVKKKPFLTGEYRKSKGAWIVTDYRITNFNNSLIGLKICYFISKMDRFKVDSIEISGAGDVGDPISKFEFKQIDNLDTFLKQFKELELSDCYIKGKFIDIDFAATVWFSGNYIRLAYDKNFKLDTTVIIEELEKYLS